MVGLDQKLVPKQLINEVQSHDNHTHRENEWALSMLIRSKLRVQVCLPVYKILYAPHVPYLQLVE